MTRLAVTGANGFVGRHVVSLAARRGFEVRGIVRSAAAAEPVVEAGGAPRIVADGDSGALAAALEACACVVHLAQIGAERGAATFEAVNVGLTEQVVDAARRAAVPRVVYFSGLGVARYGISRRSTNRYFLSKLLAEAALLRSGLGCTVFRPSFVVGRGDAFVPMVLAAFAGDGLELPGDGGYRMQPIAVTDAADLVLAAATRSEPGFPLVFDLVGPEPVSYAHLLERLAAAARVRGKPVTVKVREVPVEAADRRAREGGFLGMRPDELDCLLCDEVADPRPLEVLLGRPLLSLDDALAAAV